MTDYKDRPISRVVIAGGGTAGWMAAAALSRLVGRQLEVTLVESEEIGTVGVGEATIPTLLTMNRLLQIPEPDFIKATSGTFKLGIRFENWLYEGHDYIHSFGDTGKGCWAGGFQHFWKKGQQEGLAAEYGAYCTELRAAVENKFGILSEHKLNYAYHLDATAYGQYLRRLAEANGTRRIEGQIEHVSVSETTGFIDYLQLKDGQHVAGDLFIDCTGFRALLIEDALQTGFDDWSHWLPCNRAWAVQTELTGEPVPYTRAIAHDSGWRWRIPLQHRVGNGLVYCNDYLDDDAARERLLSLIDGAPIIDPRPIRFTTGQRRQYWNKNCVALGLSSGFIEPLESTSIHFIQNGIMWLLLMFPDSLMSQASVDEYNNKLRGEAERIRDFILLHYVANERTGEPFWDMCRDLPIPDSLSQRMALFKETGRVFKPQDDVFSENSWVQVMMGQGLIPESYHNVVDSMSNEQLRQFLNDIQRDVERSVAALPNHGAFVEAVIAHAR